MKICGLAGFVGVTLAVSVLAGCGHPAIRVASAAKAGAPELPGLPFYLRHGVCTQETVWLEPQYTLSLSVTADAQPATTKTLVLDRVGYQREETQSLMTAMSGLSGNYTLDEEHADKCPSAIGAVWDRTVAANRMNHPVAGMDGSATSMEKAESAQNLIRVVNTATVTNEVDYSKLYYINARTPWIGTGSLDAKLAGDGTLAEGNAQIQDQTWSTILGTASSLGGSVFGSGFATAALKALTAPVEARASASSALDSEEAAKGARRAPRMVAPERPFACPMLWGWPEPMKTVKYSYSVTTVVYQHDHSARAAEVAGCAAAPEGVTGGSFVVSTVADAKGNK